MSQYFIWYVFDFAGVVSFHMVCPEFSICLRISYSMSSVLFVSLVFIWCVEGFQMSQDFIWCVFIFAVVATSHMMC